MREHEKNNIRKAGVFITSLMVIVMVFVMSIGKESSLFEKKIYINAEIHDASGLKTGAFVQFKGMKIGTITSIEFNDAEKIKIKIKMLFKFLSLLKTDSVVNVDNAGLVGDKFLEIKPGTKEADNLTEEGVLYDGAGGGMNAFMKKGETIADTTNRVLARLESVLAQVEQDQKLAKTLNHMEASTLLLSKILTDFEKAAIPQKISSMTANVDKITSRIQKGPGTLNALIYDDSLHDEMRALLGGAQRNKILKYFINESIKEGKKK